MALVELTTAAIAMLILTRAVEKTGEELGKKVREKAEAVLNLFLVNNFLTILRTKFEQGLSLKP